MARRLAELNVVIGAKLSKFDKAINRVERRLNTLSRKMSRFGSDLTHNFTLPIVAFGATALAARIKFERLQVQLDVLTGSAKKGAIAFERLVQFASVTPFRLDELVKVNNTLIGFGLSADAAFQTTRRLGDIAALTGANMDNVAVAFGQAAAEGRVMTRDLRQFINNGVPIINLLADSMGVATDQILKLAKEGKISFAILDEAFRKTTSEGGKFHEGTKKLAETLGGVLSTFKDNVSIAWAEMGEAIVITLDLKARLKSLSDTIAKLLNKFKSLKPETQENYIKFALLSAIIGPMVLVGAQLVKFVTTITVAMKLLSITTKRVLFLFSKWLIISLGLASAFIYIKSNIMQFILLFLPLVKIMAKLPGQAGTMARAWMINLKAIKKTTTGWVSFGDVLRQNKKDIEDWLTVFLGLNIALPKPKLPKPDVPPDTPTTTGTPRPLNTEFYQLIGTIPSAVSQIGVGFAGVFTSIADQQRTMASQIIGYVDTIIEKFDQIRDTVVHNWNVVVDATVGLFQGMANAFVNGGNIFDAIIQGLKQLIAKLIAAAAAAWFLTTILQPLFPKLELFGGAKSFKEIFHGLLGFQVPTPGATTGATTGARGLITTGPVHAILGDNPSGREAVIPFERMGEFLKMAAPYAGGGQVVFRMQGTELIGVLENAQGHVNMIRGYGSTIG